MVLGSTHFVTDPLANRADTGQYVGYAASSPLPVSFSFSKSSARYLQPHADRYQFIQQVKHIVMAGGDVRWMEVAVN